MEYRKRFLICGQSEEATRAWKMNDQARQLEEYRQHCWGSLCRDCAQKAAQADRLYRAILRARRQADERGEDLSAWPGYARARNGMVAYTFEDCVAAAAGVK